MLIALLLKHWRGIALSVGSILLGVALCHLFYTWRIERIRAGHQEDLQVQAAELTAKCEAGKKITMEVSREYQSKIADLSRQLAGAKRLRPNRCVPTITHPAPGDNGAPADGELPIPDGVFTDDLLDFAADAEQVGRQLDSCQEFISKVWVFAAP